MRKYLFCILFIIPCLAVAQKKELSQARAFIKPRTKNYAQADKLMTQLLRDSANRTNKDIYQVLYEAVKGQYDQANERLYLKQRQDTAAFFTLAHRMFTVAETLDSLDVLPDKRGRVRLLYRQKHAQQLNTYRPNLYNAGTWHIRKQQWADAYRYLDAYLDCARQPLFASYDYASTDARMSEAAYWAVYSAYRQQSAQQVLHYSPLALRDSVHADFALQFTAEAYRWQQDTAHYVSTLEEGFRRYPLFSYFFPRLIDARLAAGEYNSALLLCDSALTICDSCELFLFAKSSTLLRMERWQQSVSYSERLIRQNDSLPEPYFNAATAFFNMAVQPGAENDRTQQLSNLQKARTYMEYYRQLMPGEKRKWAPVLYRIYLSLNLGRQFDEMDKILKTL